MTVVALGIVEYDGKRGFLLNLKVAACVGRPTIDSGAMVVVADFGGGFVHQSRVFADVVQGSSVSKFRNIFQ